MRRHMSKTFHRVTRQTLPMRYSTWTPNSVLANSRTFSRPCHIFEALLEVHFFPRIFGLEVVISVYGSARYGHQSHSIRFEATSFTGNRNVKSAGGSVVKSIEAESPIVSVHHINILLFRAFSASRESCLMVSKNRTLLEVRCGGLQLLRRCKNHHYARAACSACLTLGAYPCSLSA